MLKNQIEDIKLPSTKLNGFYRGIVEDNNDPSKMGRVKVRVFGLHTENKIKSETDGIKTEELPWAEPILGIVEGSISGYGLWSVPVQGSQVILFFENGNYSQPRYFGTIPGIVSSLPDTSKGFNDPDGNYPDSTGTDYASEATSTNYPNIMVLKTHGGVIMEIDNVDKFVKITHPSGTIIELDNDGDKIETIANDKYETVGGKKTENISGDKTETMTKLTITASGEITITGNSINLVGNTTIQGLITGTGGSGGTLDGTFNISSGDVVAEGVSLKSHTHSGVTAGGSDTGPPN